MAENTFVLSQKAAEQVGETVRHVLGGHRNPSLPSRDSQYAGSETAIVKILGEWLGSLYFPALVTTFEKATGTWINLPHDNISTTTCYVKHPRGLYLTIGARYPGRITAISDSDACAQLTDDLPVYDVVLDHWEFVRRTGSNGAYGEIAYIRYQNAAGTWTDGEQVWANAVG